MQTTLDGRVALVTGGSRGVGAGIARRLAADGARVAVNYRRDEAAAKAVVEAIEAAGGTAAAYSASVDDGEATAAMVEAVRRDLGPVDLFVSNAGTASRGRSIADSDFDEFDRLLRVHALGPLRLIRQLLPDLRAAERGDVVVVSSVTVEHAPPCSAPYTMAKSALETAARTLAREERSHGIHVNIVAPGLVNTDMGRKLVHAVRGAEIAELGADSPFGRVCEPADVAAAVAYLASPDAGYLTGQRLVVDGGGPDPAVV